MQHENSELPKKAYYADVVVCNRLFLYHDICRFAYLKFIQLLSAGYDRVPMDYINKHDISIANVGDTYAVPIAEWVVLKLLEVAKMSKRFYQQQQRHIWKKQRDIIELFGKTAIIVGFGNIGSEVARRLRSFGMRIIAISKSPLTADRATLADEWYPVSEIDNILPRGNVVVLSLPLTPESYLFLNQSRLSLMCDDSILINVGRGSLLDESALIDLLDCGKFRGVALDVFETEPLPSESPLWNIERVLITPHISYFSDKIVERLFNLILKNLTLIIGGT